MAFCHLCERYFSSDVALQQHQSTSSKHRLSYCSTCSRSFVSEAALTQHYKQSPRHHYCGDCERHFVNQSALLSHYANSSLHQGEFCRWCQEFFETESELDEHDKEVHWPCARCGEIYNTVDDLKEHKADAHWYCAACDRTFNHEHTLNQHLASSIHKPRIYRCPGRKCNKSFIDYGSVMLHLESGACQSGVTRQMIDKFAVQHDKNRVITDGAKLISYDGDWQPPPSITSYATERSFDGAAYECIMCHRTFRKLESLNQHLSSPAHADEIYRCPQAFSGCGMHFNTLSGLVQHVEHSGCGVRKFAKKMRNVMDDMTSRMRRLGL